MALLRDVLELIHTSRRRFRTAWAAGRTNETSAWRLWWAGDDRFRFERDADGRTSVAVRAGPVWWTVDPDGEAHTNDGDPKYHLGIEPEFGLLHTRSLLASSVLEILREEPVAARPAAVLRANRRPEVEHARWWGFWGTGDPLEIAIDLERGVALGGFGMKVEEIGFDQDFSPDVFAKPYGADRRVRSVIERPREMSLEEARRAAPFPVLLPSFLPEGARLLRCLVDRTDPAE
jgi:outer membrane lipoprotein-sorting protein